MNHHLKIRETRSRSTKEVLKCPRGLTPRPSASRKNANKTSHNTAQGAPRHLPVPLRGSAHMVFWMGPAVQAPFRGFVARRHSLSRGLHSTLRAFAPGGVSPHSAHVLAFRPSSKKPRHPGPTLGNMGLGKWPFGPRI